MQLTTYFDEQLVLSSQAEGEIRFVSPEAKSAAYFEAVFSSALPSRDLYVFFPACCYQGNQFQSVKRSYPPMYLPEEAKAEGMPILITDVPRLETDGSGCIEVTAGDLSVPCVGLFSPSAKKGLLLFTVQEINGKNLGLSYQGGSISLTYPHMRKKSMYRWPFMVESTDRGISFFEGEEIRLPYRLFEFPCEDLPAFFRFFASHRKCMGMDASHAVLPQREKLWNLLEDKYNRLNYRPERGFYGVGLSEPNESPTQVWQPGWVGGAMATAALMKRGGKESFQRSLSTIDYLFSTQTASGLFEGVTDRWGHPFGDAFGLEEGNRWHLIRKSADVLYFLFFHFDILKEKGLSIPENWMQGTRRLADAFVTLWERYGELGQFVNVDTGEIVVGGSTAGAMACGGLARAYTFFGREEYLKTAKECARLYCDRDLLHGYTTGGPGEILQCPDSESAFALLESLVVLYETTREKEWLDLASYAADFCSSWVVSYNYQFPAESEFGRLGMKTIGSVFANAQNKHSAPGICTLSGDCLRRLAQYTGNSRYLELYHDITQNIGQYLSRPDRPILTWDNPPKRMPDGTMCERVNMSDWEGYSCIGGVFYGSCWCEVSAMLFWAGL